MIFYITTKYLWISRNYWSFEKHFIIKCIGWYYSWRYYNENTTKYKHTKKRKLVSWTIIFETNTAIYGENIWRKNL